MSENESKQPDSEQISLLENVYEFIIPKYREAHDLMVSMLDFSTANELRVVDLGSGLGGLSRQVFATFPRATIFGIDNNEQILRRGREKLLNFKQQFLPFHRDLNQPSWSEDLESIDAVISSFTLDYLPLERHKQLVQEAFNILNPLGRWVSCEFFKAQDSRINRVFHEIEIQLVRKAMKNGEVSQKQIDQLSQSTVLRQQHHVCTLDTKIEWMRIAGFDKIEVPWKFLNLAIISAVR